LSGPWAAQDSINLRLVRELTAFCARKGFSHDAAFVWRKRVRPTFALRELLEQFRCNLLLLLGEPEDLSEGIFERLDHTKSIASGDWSGQMQAMVGVGLVVMASPVLVR
jgi:hypothetical protein